jgi:biotin transport system substrate-specific component
MLCHYRAPVSAIHPTRAAPNKLPAANAVTLIIPAQGATSSPTIPVPQWSTVPKMNTRDIVYIALFAAFTAALAVFPPLVLPVIGVPITAQSMGAMIAGSVLGAKRGGAAMALFVALVAAGLPLLPGGRGGMAVIAGPGGGFILGWIAAAFVTGWICERLWSNLDVFKAFAAAFIGGIVVDYALGIFWLSAVTGLSIYESAAGSVGFIPGDLIKAAIAATVAVTVRRSYPLIEAPRRA